MDFRFVDLKNAGLSTILTSWMESLACKSQLKTPPSGL